MGDTANGSWDSNELGGYIRREEARATVSSRPSRWKRALACGAYGLTILLFPFILLYFRAKDEQAREQAGERR